MIDITDPVVKRFIENLHKAVERKNKNLSDSSSYDDYILENRVFKIFCEIKNIDPRRCADKMNERYDTSLDNDGIIKILKATRLSYQDKRAELLDWAEDTAEAFAKALESHKQKDYDDYMELRNRVIKTRSDERYKIQERIACLMLYVRHPEIDSGSDFEVVEKFGNVYMKHLFCEASDFLKNICGVKSKAKNLSEAKNLSKELTLKDFLALLYTKYPELDHGLDAETIKKLEACSLKNFIEEIIADKLFEEFAEDIFLKEFAEDDNPEILQADMTIEEFLQNDPDAQAMLISPKNFVESI